MPTTSRQGKSIARIPKGVVTALVRHHWPGNIRELQNFIQRSVITTRGAELGGPVAELVDRWPSIPGVSTLADAERAHIISTLRDTNWVVGGREGAAARLGVLRTTLISMTRKPGTSRDTAHAGVGIRIRANTHWRADVISAGRPRHAAADLKAAYSDEVDWR
jgi:transcriptional regulator with GAF, ATPase, and Fis domain